MKIGYQGVRGAFSEAAIKLYYEIENIKDAVNRNNGDCILKKEENEFVAVIILPL